MKTPITYYGGKQTLLKYLLPLIPQHKLYCEPFFGGGAVFFAKPMWGCDPRDPFPAEGITPTNKVHGAEGAEEFFGGFNVMKKYAKFPP